MRKNWLLILWLLPLLPVTAFAVSGGELCYKYLGPGVKPNTAKYEVSLYMSANCKSAKRGDRYPGAAYFVFWDPTPGSGPIFTETTKLDSVVSLNYTPENKCISYRESYCFSTGRIRAVVELPIIEGDYIVTSSLLSYVNTPGDNLIYSYRPDIDNLMPLMHTEAVYTTIIPGTKKMGNQYNSSPLYNYPQQVVVCGNTSFSYDFSQKDPDADKIIYEMCDVEVTDSSQVAFPVKPPYMPVFKKDPLYDPEHQMGENVTLDKNTGILSGVGLETGVFMINICVSEYRNGKLINQHQRNQLFFITPCLQAQAQLPKEYIKCKDFTFNFQNQFVSTMPVAYHWDFGVPGKTDDTSALEKPVFTFPDTGIYKIKLVISGLGDNSECHDTATSSVRVYPGFKPGFIFKQACASVPVEFTDTTKTKYGTINSWNWDFGDYFNEINDTSTLQNPIYQYSSRGDYLVNYIVGSSVGCIDTVKARVSLLDILLLKLSNDTLICAADSIQIFANSIGKITWEPNYHISNPHSFSPWVNPDVDTRYVAHVDAGPGCAADDSVLIRSLKSVQISLPQRQMDICVADTAHLFAFSNGANAYQWAGNNIVSPKDSADIFAHPLSNAWYFITATLGSCRATDSMQVRIFDYPNIRVYGDTTMCAGKAISIHVRGNADRYTWTPATQVSDVNSLDPVIAPLISTAFHVEATDTTGCTKPVDKRVIINVIHKFKANAGNDTTITAGQSLQLNAGGAINYVWTPAAGLSDPNISNPKAVLNTDMEYYVKVSDDEGCTEYDSLHVRVLKTGYDILVPNAFTPNGDGLNDIFRPIPVGIKEFYSFEIYDRWGKIVFRSTESNKGWDGRVNAQPAQTGTYVWIVKGMTVDNKLIEKHGAVVLLR